MIDATTLSAQEVKDRINAAILKRRDEPLDAEEVELLTYALGDMLNKAHGLMATLIVHTDSIPRDALHIMQLVRLSMGHFAIVVREAKETISGQA